MTNQEYWETEMSGNTTDMPGALQEAGWIQASLVGANMNAFHYWWLTDLISNNSFTIKAYVLGNYSKFIRPGYYRMGATAAPTSGIQVSAFKDTNNSSPSKIVFVAINNNSSATSQTFSLNGLNVTSVTPWITDSSHNLVALSAVSVSGNSFTYSLPSSSVVSFVGTNNGGATATNTPVPATNTPTKTNTPVPPTNTFTNTFTKTNTPVPPTNTFTNTFTKTNTPVPPTNTFTNTYTPTNTFTKTNTPVPPTATPITPVPTNTSTNTAPPTNTGTPIVPTATPTTPVPTNTPIVPTATPTTPVPTNTPIVPTATPTTPVPTNTPIVPTFTPTVFTGSGALTVYLLSAVTTNSTNSPHPQIEVANTGTTALNLNNVEVRYWFNCDCTGQSVQAWVDWAGLIPAGTSVTGNIQTTVVPTNLGGQTSYISYKFTGGIVLQPGQMIQIQSRFNLSDWSNMLQSNDWSFSGIHLLYGEQQNNGIHKRSAGMGN